MADPLTPALVEIGDVDGIGPVQLRSWRSADVDAVWDAFHDPAIVCWDPSLPPATRAVVARWIEGWIDQWQRGTVAAWALGSPTGTDLLGAVTLRHLDLARQPYPPAHCTIGYWVVDAARGHGLAARAAARAAAWAAAELGIHRVELRHDVANVASCAVARRAGFELEGTTRASQPAAGGWVDEHLHAVIDPR